MALATSSVATQAACDDAWLWRIMQNHKNKQMIARLEETLTSFVNDSNQTSLSFPPRSAFHRRVCQSVAKRYRLAHRLDQCHDPSLTHSGPEKLVSLVLIKTKNSITPCDTLAKFADGPQPPNDDMSKSHAPSASRAQNSSRIVVVTAKDENVARPATFLRRPRSAEGRLNRVPLTNNYPVGNPSGSALKKFSEEDYQKVRARIFKPSPVHSEDESSSNDDSASHPRDVAKAVKVGVVAKGPVEGSTGFDRRRNRRTPSQSTHASEKQNKRTINVNERTNDAFSTGGQGGQKRPQDNFSRPNPTSSSLSSLPPASQAQPIYKERKQSDLQDPDFDRRYDKWAVRHRPPAPTPQQVPVPIFGQLLYPYAVQASPHMHANNMHMRPVGAQMQQGSVPQYQSVMHHAPNAGMMYQHLGQSVGGAGEYAVSGGISLGDQARFGVLGRDPLADARSQGFAQLQPQPMQGQVGRQRSPAYGLDSTIDFPPLP